MCIWILPLVSFDMSGFSFLHSIFHKSWGKLLVMLPVFQQMSLWCQPAAMMAGLGGPGGPGARTQNQQDKCDRVSCWPCPASLPQFVTLLQSSPVLFVPFLKCFSHPWEKLPKSPAASTAPLLLHREQKHWVLVQHRAVSATRGCVGHWAPFPASLGPSPSMDTAVFPVPCSTHTLLPFLGASQARAVYLVEGSRRGNKHSANMFWTVTSESGTRGRWIHWMGLSTSTSTWWYSLIQCASVIYTRGWGEALLSWAGAAGQERGEEWDGKSEWLWQTAIAVCRKRLCKENCKVLLRVGVMSRTLVEKSMKNSSTWSWVMSPCDVQLTGVPKSNLE